MNKKTGSEITNPSIFAAATQIHLKITHEFSKNLRYTKKNMNG
jgi:hypothetical protein